MLVSLCTVCKNRSSHYKQTILQNIQDNLQNGNVEFILLDYNSGDDLEEWVKLNLSDYIEKGILTYYKTFEPQYFNRSHSRNMAFRLAKGDLICNVDADNYTGYLFSSYLNEQFILHNNVFFCAGGDDDNIACSDIGGRICMHNEVFQQIGGYDEAMVNYGLEDFDLINRMKMAGVNKMIIESTNFLDTIKHNTKDRIIEEFPYKNFKKLLISYLSPSSSKLLLIFLDNTFAMATMTYKTTIDSTNKNERFNSATRAAISIPGADWIIGTVKGDSEGIAQLAVSNSSASYNLRQIGIKDELYLVEDIDQNHFYVMKDTKLIEQGILFYSETYNRNKMEQNILQKVIKPNNGPIGCGTVYKNFDYNTPIILE